MLPLALGFPAIFWLLLLLRFSKFRGAFDAALLKLCVEEGVDMDDLPSGEGGVLDVEHVLPADAGSLVAVSSSVLSVYRVLTKARAVRNQRDAKDERGGGGGGCGGSAMPRLKNRVAVLMAKRWVQLTLFVAMEAYQLVIQFLSLCEPTANNIVLPILLGSLIALDAMLLPTLYVLRWERVLVVMKKLINMGYYALSVPSLFAIYNEEPGPTGMVSFEPLNGRALAFKVLASVGPQLFFAIGLLGLWNKSVRAEAQRTLEESRLAGDGAYETDADAADHKTDTHAADEAADKAATAAVTAAAIYAQTDEAVGEEAADPATSDEGGEELPRSCKRPEPVALFEKLYALVSACMGVLCLVIVSGGWDCARFRTCQLPSCSVSVANLPFGATASWESSTDFNFSPQQQFWGSAHSVPGNTLENDDVANRDEWRWLQRSNLKVRYKFNQTADGTYMLTITTWPQQGQTIDRSLTNAGEDVGTVGETTMDSSDQCVASFHVQCQEALTRQSLRNRLEYWEFVRFRSDRTVKLVLADPKPDCWTDSSSRWWTDHVLWGPTTLVGRNYDGTPLHGLVVTTVDCLSSPNERCLRVDANASLHPAMGRSPLQWRDDWDVAWSAAPRGVPTEWFGSAAVGDFDLVFSVQEAELAAPSSPQSGGGGLPSSPQSGGGGLPVANICMGDATACAPHTDQGACEAATFGSSNQPCTWGVAPAPAGR